MVKTTTVIESRYEFAVLDDLRGHLSARDGWIMTTDTPTAGTSPHRGRRRIVATLALAAVALSLPAGYRWWSHPDLIEDRGDGMSMDPAPVTRAARSAAVTFPDSEAHDPTTITFHGASAHLIRDSAQAEVSFYICRENEAEGVIGYVGDDLATYCSDLRPITDGTDFAYPNPAEYVVVVVTPTRPGTTHLTRVDLDYALGASRLFRRGTDSVRVDMTIHAT
jgi:hypothetical protein